MITKILNKILKKNIDNDWYNDGNIINYYCVYDNERIIERINAHELVHRCKIWAFVNGYELLSGTISEDNGDMMFEMFSFHKIPNNIIFHESVTHKFNTEEMW